MSEGQSIQTVPPDFEERCRELGVELEPGDAEKLGQFLGLLLEANATVNLTAITEPAEAWRKHILDALSMVGVVASAVGAAGPDGSPSPVSVIDVGSGGGVPAIPLAVVLPDVRFTLVEATGKKVEFLRKSARELGLRNVRVLNERAEKLGQDHRVHREKYDLAMARALGHLAVVVELCGPLVRPGGVMIAVKGAKADQELDEAKDALGMVGLRHVQTIETPTGRLVILEKTTRTPRLYPRRDGEPARVPLGMKRSDDKKRKKPRADGESGANPADNAD